MANLIQIKRSAVTATPPSLLEGELAYSEQSSTLFIGTAGGTVVTKIGGEVDVLKLAGIESGAEVNLVDSVNGQTGVVSLAVSDIADVVLTTLTNNDILIYNNTLSQWENVASTSVGVTDHTLLSNIGTNTHAQIDTHIGDATIHYTQAAISITKSQVSDFTEGDYVHTTGIETIAGAKTFSNDLVVNGNFTVNGTTTTIDSTNVTIADNIITLNSGEVGAGVTLGTSGILIDRGLSTDASIIWDEAGDFFSVGLVGAENEVLDVTSTIDGGTF